MRELIGIKRFCSTDYSRLTENIDVKSFIRIAEEETACIAGDRGQGAGGEFFWDGHNYAILYILTVMCKAINILLLRGLMIRG